MEFKVGDRVQIKEWDEMVEEYGLDHTKRGICFPFSRFDEDMKHLCGRQATIKHMYFNEIRLIDWSDTSGKTDWTYSTYMIKPVDKTIIDVKSLYPNAIPIDFSLQLDFYKELVGGIWEKEESEERDMNKILELYKERKEKEIREKYEELINKEFEENEIVKGYNTLIEKFEKDLEDFVKKYEDPTDSMFDYEYDDNVYRYTLLGYKVKDTISKKYHKDKEKEINELRDLVKEVDAQLSMSDDVTYQRDILKDYGILDKKTGKLV